MDILNILLLHRFIVKHSRAQEMKDIQPEELFRVLQGLNMFKFEKTRNCHLSDEELIMKYICT